MTNRDTFENELTTVFTQLFKINPYKGKESQTTPRELAKKTTDSFFTDTPVQTKDIGIQMVCTKLHIIPTKEGIKNYLRVEEYTKDIKSIQKYLNNKDAAKTGMKGFRELDFPEQLKDDACVLIVTLQYGTPLAIEMAHKWLER